MAGDWIKMRSDLLTHPKVVRIMSALKADKLRVIGGLHAVWCLFDMHSTDGILDGYTTEILDSHLGWPGFSNEMAKIGWLEIKPDSLVTPRFDEHNGQSAKRRAQETERKRLAREAEESSAREADEKRTREEKRREEEILKDLAAEAARPKKEKQPKFVFTPPTIEELELEFYGRVDDHITQARLFHAHHAARGWKLNRGMMVSWPSAVTTWVGNVGKWDPPQQKTNILDQISDRTWAGE